MEKRLLTISKPELSNARNNGDTEVLQKTFSDAEEVISAGGMVNIQQIYSDGSKEIIRMINTLEKLELFKSRYLD